MHLSSRRWLRLAAALVVLAAIIGAALAAGFAYRAQKSRRMLADARSLAAAGQWQKAKDLFGFYLIKHPADSNVMREFANASLRVTENRPAALRDAAGACYQIALAEPEQPENALQLLRMLEQNAYWGDLEYYASALLRARPDDHHVQYYKAYALDRLARNEEALAAYQRLVELKTLLPDVYGNLARLLERQGQSAAADAVLDAAGPLNSTPGAIQLQRARLEIARQHFDQAHEFLRQARELLGATAAVCRAGAELAITSRNWSEAAAYLEQCRAIETDWPEHYLLLALALQRQDKRDAALSLIKEMDPVIRASSPELMTTLCEIYIDQNRLDLAANAAADYVRAYPDHLLVHQYLEARMMLARGETASAIERLLAVARGNPQLASARYHLSLAYLRQGDYERARTVLESFLRDFPQDENGLTLREVLYAGEVSRKQALSRANSLLAAAAGPLKDTPEPWALLAEFYLEAADPESINKASSALTRALLLAPEHPAAMRAAIRLFLREGNSDGALSMCKRYLKVQPNDPNVLSQQAALLVRAGRPAEALDAIERALQIVERPAGIFIRATALLALGHCQEALADLQRVAGDEEVDPADHDAAMAEAYLGLKDENLAQRYYDSAKEKSLAAHRPFTDQLNRLKDKLERSNP